MNVRRHGASVRAPDESGFVADEKPAPKNPKTRPARSSPPPPPDDAAAGLGRKAWSVTKLLLGVLIVVVTSGGVAWGAHRYALTSPRFALKNIEISGNKKRSDSELATVAGLKLGDNVFAIDTQQLERKLLTDPWIREVKATRTLPNTIRIELDEREAAALAAIGDHIYLVTKTGEPFKQIEDGEPFDLPIVTGVQPEDLGRDRARAVERIALALEIVRHWDRIPMSKVHPAQEIHLNPGGDAVLTVGKTGITLQLGNGPWRKKLLMAERVMHELEKKGRAPGIVFADNQAHPEKVVVRMR